MKLLKLTALFFVLTACSNNVTGVSEDFDGLEIQDSVEVTDTINVWGDRDPVVIHPTDGTVVVDDTLFIYSTIVDTIIVPEDSFVDTTNVGNPIVSDPTDTTEVDSE